MNTGGGLVAFGHPVGATGVKQALEVFRQMKGLCGDYQVLSLLAARVVLCCLVYGLCCCSDEEAADDRADSEHGRRRQERGGVAAQEHRVTAER